MKEGKGKEKKIRGKEGGRNKDMGRERGRGEGDIGTGGGEGRK